jgi:4-amino-4-deoxy-L-arabinose transferase-like glycosyltransferase
VLYLSTIREGHEWGDDFSQYIRHASNLAQGLPYTASSYLYNVDNPAVGPRVYPPGFPVLLAPVIRTFGLALAPMKVEIVLFFAAALFLIYLLIQPLMPPAAAAAAVLMVGLNPFFWDFKDQILSDIPFLFFFVATLLCLTRADQRDRGMRARTMLAVLGGAAMFAAYATRVVGIVLLPSLVVRDLIRHRRLTKEGLLAAATFVGLAGVTYVVGPRDSS